MSRFIWNVCRLFNTHEGIDCIRGVEFSCGLSWWGAFAGRMHGAKGWRNIGKKATWLHQFSNFNIICWMHLKDGNQWRIFPYFRLILQVIFQPSSLFPSLTLQLAYPQSSFSNTARSRLFELASCLCLRLQTRITTFFMQPVSEVGARDQTFWRAKRVVRLRSKSAHVS
jgi:hypothetical protein